MIKSGSTDGSMDRRSFHPKQQCTRQIASRWLLFTVTVLSFLVGPSSAKSNSAYSSDDFVYGNTFIQDWLYNSNAISFQVEGCVWGYVEDSEEVGCLEDESDEGTTNWYMMASCRRPQVVFSVYASSSGSANCNNKNFMGSYVTTGGLSEFVYYVQSYDGNFNYDGDDSYGFDNLPNCEQGNNGYVGLDCSDGAWVLNYFNDQYCVSRTGNQYNKLKNVNNMMKNYEQCISAYKSGDDADASLVHQLIYYSEPCSSLDYNLCKDGLAFEERSSRSGTSRGSSGKGWSSRGYTGGPKSWVTKLKYAVGGLFLLFSFIMFTGILFTNRRRRRAMMMRKYRQAKKAKREKNKDSSSGKKSRSGSKRRSKSRNRDKGEGGVFT